MSAEARLSQLGLTLPPAPEPKGAYKPLVVVGSLAYTSGHLPVRADGSLIHPNHILDPAFADRAASVLLEMISRP